MKHFYKMFLIILSVVFMMSGCQDISKNPQKTSAQNKSGVYWDDDSMSNDETVISQDDYVQSALNFANQQAQVVYTSTVNAVGRAVTDNFTIEQGVCTGIGGIKADYIQSNTSLTDLIQKTLGASFKGNWLTVVNLSTGCTYALWSDTLSCEELQKLSQLTAEQLDEYKGSVGCYPVKK